MNGSSGLRVWGTAEGNRTCRSGLLTSEPEKALGALAPIPERRVAANAFCSGEAGIEARVLLVPLCPLGVRHLANHESTRGNLLTDVLELRLTLRGCSLLHSPHLESLVAEARYAGHQSE